MVLKRIGRSVLRKAFPRRAREKDRLEKVFSRFWSGVKGLPFDKQVNRFDKLAVNLSVKMALDDLKVSSPQKRKKISKSWERLLAHTKLQLDFGKDPNRPDILDEDIIFSMRNELGGDYALSRFNRKVESRYKKFYDEFFR